MKLTPFCTPCRTGSHADCSKVGGLWSCNCTHAFGNGSESRIFDRLTFALQYLELAAVELEEFAPKEIRDKRGILRRALATVESHQDILRWHLEAAMESREKERTA